MTFENVVEHVMRAKLAVLLIIIFGCSSPEAPKREATSWIGRPKTELITAWGSPDYEADNWNVAAGESCSGTPLFAIAVAKGLVKTGDTDWDQIKRECIERQKQEWGMSGTVSYRWERVRNKSGIPPSYRGTIVGNTITLTPFRGSDPSSEYLHCYINFEIDKKGFVKRADKYGNDC